MIDFAELTRTAAEVAEPIAARIAATGLGMLGTVRANGSPRVSPIEVGPYEGRFYVGMMPGSQKHRDATRDPRYCLVTAIADRQDLGGEGKLFGVLDLVTDAARAEAILRHHAAAADFDADALVGSPMFELLIDMAAWQQVVDDAWTTISWREGTEGVRRRSRTA